MMHVRARWHTGAVTCVLFGSLLCPGPGRDCIAQQIEGAVLAASPESIAAALGWPVEKLQVLDHRSLRFAFLEGRYEIYEARNEATGETTDVALDLDNGRRIDPAELSRLNCERASVEGRKLDPQLLDLVLRHPGLEQVEVRLNFSLDSIRDPDESPQRDWLEPDLRHEFQARLDEELRRFGIDTPFRVRPDFPALDATLSVHQVTKLGGSHLVKSIVLLSDPVIINR